MEYIADLLRCSRYTHKYKVSSRLLASTCQVSNFDQNHTYALYMVYICV